MLPGVPVTFQGDECAFLGSRESHDAQRYPLQWSRCDQTILLFYHRLGWLKDNLAPLHSPVWRGYVGKNGVLAFFRGVPGRGESLAVFNDREQPARITLPSGTWRGEPEMHWCRATVGWFGTTFLWLISYTQYALYHSH